MVCYALTVMKKCPQCDNSYPEPFQFCPVDGSPLEEGGETETPAPEIVESPPPAEATVSVRTLALGLGILVMTGVLAFTAVFFYQYLRPKYGSLIVKTVPAGAMVWLNGEQRGVSPITLSDLRTGPHQVRVTMEGYKELVQGVQVVPYSTESLHLNLEPLVAQLTNEQLAQVEDLRKKLESAQKENILLPPPDDYNVWYFANKILEIDPANSYALEAKSNLADGIRRAADVAYARGDWLEAEKQYKLLAILFPDEATINERLADLSGKIEAGIKDRQKQIDGLKEKAEAAFKAGMLVPPEKDNALDCMRNILRLDKKDAYARSGMVRLKEMLQNRGDTKIATGDWQEARTDFRTVLQYFPDDLYSKTRLAMVEGKLQEAAQAEQRRLQGMQEEQQQVRQRIANLRQSALNAYKAGAYQRAVSEWQEYLKLEPNSDEAYFSIGAAYLEQKQLDNAILYFEKAVTLNPRNALAQLNLAILYDQHRHDYKRAEEHLRKAKELGGIENYSPDRLQAMIQDLQSRAQIDALQKSAFPIEHKHAFSSCQGTLQITDRGVEYKTSEADHSFFEAYADIRSLSIDGDTLSIRTRNNKKYNFQFLNDGDGAVVRRLAQRHLQVTD